MLLPELSVEESEGSSVGGFCIGNTAGGGKGLGFIRCSAALGGLIFCCCLC